MDNQGGVSHVKNETERRREAKFGSCMPHATHMFPTQAPCYFTCSPSHGGKCQSATPARYNSEPRQSGEASTNARDLVLRRRGGGAGAGQRGKCRPQVCPRSIEPAGQTKLRHVQLRRVLVCRAYVTDSARIGMVWCVQFSSASSLGVWCSAERCDGGVACGPGSVVHRANR